MSAEVQWFTDLRAGFAADMAVDQALVVLLPLQWPDPPGAKIFAEERARMAKFRRPEDARAHGLARMLARFLLGLDMADGPFQLTERGKPYHRSAPGFSLSHAGGMVAVAVAGQGEIGVDIETRAQDWDPMTLEARVCHPSESAWLHHLPKAQQLEGFMTIWTRKEALLKALGIGLVDDLASMDTGPECLTNYRPTASAFALWSLPASGVACAVAVDPRIKRVTLMLAGEQAIHFDRA